MLSRWLLLAALLLVPASHGAQEIATIINELPNLKGVEKGKALNKLLNRTRANDPKATLHYGQQALAHFELFPDDWRKITVLNNMAWASMTLGQYEAAKQLAKTALKVAKNANDQHGLYSAFNVLGLIDWRMSNHYSALDNYQQGLAIAQLIEDEQGVGVTLNNMAIIHDIIGEHEKALSYFLRALHHKQNTSDLKGAAIVMNNIAEIYLSYGDHSQALQYQLQSMQIRERQQDQPGLAEIYNNIGITYHKLNDHQAAKQHFDQALQRYKQLDDKLGIAEAHDNLGKLAGSRQAYQTAMDHYRQTLAIAEQIDNKAMQSRVRINMANILNDQNIQAQALDEVQLGLKLAQKHNLKSLTGKGYLQLAKIQLAMEKPDTALKNAQHSTRLAVALNDKTIMLNSYLLLSQIHQKLNQPWLALGEYEKYKRLNDDLYNQASDQRIALLRVHFEAQQQQNEIALLKADRDFQQYRLERQAFERNIWLAALSGVFIVILLTIKRQHQARVNRTLKQNLESQKQLIRAVAHEFRAPLARVQLAFDLLIDELEQDSPLSDKINQGLAELETLVKEALNFIRNENQSTQLNCADVPLKPLTGKLIDQQLALYPDKQFEYTCIQEHDFIVKADPNLLSRVLTNLLSNAARHAETRVKVSCFNRKHFIEINVEDDGCGIEKNQRERVFEPFVRLDPSRNRSSGGIGLGLSLVKSIAKAHNAKVTVLDSALGGAKIQLQWPL